MSYNASSRLECYERNNNTHMVFDFWNGTSTCSHAPNLSITSTGPSHSCAPISVTYEDQKVQFYGHIECATPNATSSSPQHIPAHIKAAAAEHRHSAPAARQPRKSFLASIFNL